MQTAWTTLGLAVGLASAHASSSRPAVASATGSAAVVSASSLASITYSVSGTCEGFASDVTGGGDATPVIPADIDELKELLTSDEPQVIVLDKTFNFLGSEGTKTETGCAPYGTGDMCQEAIDTTGTWCSSDYPSVSVTYDVAGTEGIEVASNKTILGVDGKGVLLGKGLRFTNGASNIIVQNIMISDLNPQYVWGGDALTFSGADTVWVDHVTTQYLGRQHYVFGEDASHRITLSNNYINGYTNYSAGCDSYHYWAIELVGSDDQITFQSNYVYHTSGRSPALSGSTLFHAVNSVWEDNNGHAIEGDSNGQGLFEGCVFKDVNTVITSDFSGHLFGASSSNLDSCETYLGRACEANTFSGSGIFSEDDTTFLSNFTGLSVASAVSASEAESNVFGDVGCGKVTTYSTSSSSTSTSGNFVSVGSLSSGASNSGSPSGSSGSSGSASSGSGSSGTSSSSGATVSVIVGGGSSGSLSGSSASDSSSGVTSSSGSSSEGASTSGISVSGIAASGSSGSSSSGSASGSYPQASSGSSSTGISSGSSSSGQSSAGSNGSDSTANSGSSTGSGSSTESGSSNGSGSSVATGSSTGSGSATGSGSLIGSNSTTTAFGASQSGSFSGSTISTQSGSTETDSSTEGPLSVGSGSSDTTTSSSSNASSGTSSGAVSTESSSSVGSDYTPSSAPNDSPSTTSLSSSSKSSKCKRNKQLRRAMMAESQV